MKNAIAVLGQGFVGGSLTTVFSERGIKPYVFDKTGKVATGGIDLMRPVPEVPIISAVYHSDGRSPKILNQKPVDEDHNIERFVSLVEEQSDFTGIFFVCVPTPMKQDGSCDLSIVDSVLSDLSSAPRKEGTVRIAVVKSTVPPGSTAAWNDKFGKFGPDSDLHVIFCPEFLTEANALEDMRNQDRIILGGPRPWINKVKQIFERAFPQVPIHKTSSTTAEMVKYITNIHLAVKVSLANEFYQICNALDDQGLDLDYDKTIEYALLDTRLGTSHWKVPGPMPADDTGEPAFGWAGSCFVKDLNSMMHQAASLGIDPKVMRGAWEKNLEVRPQRDWEKLVGRAISSLPPETETD